jgi:hypothetical protein
LNVITPSPKGGPSSLPARGITSQVRDGLKVFRSR